MSALVISSIERGGLGDVLAARHAKDFTALAAAKKRLEAADLLLLGALADLVRKDEVGNDVRIYANVEAERSDALVFGETERGLPLLRAIAVARITGPLHARIRILYGGDAVGLEIVQIALGFGASELEGRIANKRGLPIADDATKKLKGQGMVAVQALAKKELAGLLRRQGREPVFMESKVATTSEARP